MRRVDSVCCWRWLPTAILALLGVVWQASNVCGQGGIVLPGLGESATNIDVTTGSTVGYGDGVMPDFGGGGGAGGFENLDNLIDNLVGGGDQKWLDFQGDTQMMPVHFTLTAPKTLKYYTLTSANDAEERDPYTWRLLGTNVANPTINDFTLLETRDAVDFPVRMQTQLYGPLTNTTAYTTYRFEFR